MRRIILPFCLTAVIATAAPIPQSIPRSPRNSWVDETAFSGGKPGRATLEALRSSPLEDNSGERWVFDFSAANKKAGSFAPEFRVVYQKAESWISSEGLPHEEKPPRFALLFRAIDHNKLKMSELKKLVNQSAFIKDIIVYPAIENGDLAIELLLKQAVAYDAFQPVQKEGRLVLDLRSPRP